MHEKRERAKLAVILKMGKDFARDALLIFER